MKIFKIMHITSFFMLRCGMFFGDSPEPLAPGHLPEPDRSSEESSGKRSQSGVAGPEW